METKTMSASRHMGKQVKRFREAIGMKQETLAAEMKTSQQNISYYEKQKNMDEKLFSQLAHAMGISPEVLKNFNVEEAVNIFSNTFSENSQAGNNFNFNPIDKILEQSSKIEELYKELLKSEREKVEVLTKANELMSSTLEKLKSCEK
jgi:transcriptional regulator with XRE-family HTH domain